VGGWGGGGRPVIGKRSFRHALISATRNSAERRMPLCTCPSMNLSGSAEMSVCGRRESSKRLPLMFKKVTLPLIFKTLF
jgi:hypothetical protein